MRDLIVSVPDHCLSFYFSQIQNTAIRVLLCSSPGRVFSHLLTACVYAAHHTLFFILVCSKMFIFLKYPVQSVLR